MPFHRNNQAFLTGINNFVTDYKTQPKSRCRCVICVHCWTKRRRLQSAQFVISSECTSMIKWTMNRKSHECICRIDLEMSPLWKQRRLALLKLFFPFIRISRTSRKWYTRCLPAPSLWRSAILNYISCLGIQWRFLSRSKCYKVFDEGNHGQKAIYYLREDDEKVEEWYNTPSYF